MPLEDDSAGYQCKHVAFNPNCYSEATNAIGCQDLRVSLTRSYVRYEFLYHQWLKFPVGTLGNL